MFCSQAGEAVCVWGKTSMNPVSEKGTASNLATICWTAFAIIHFASESYSNAVGEIVDTKSLYSQIQSIKMARNANCEGRELATMALRQK